MDQRRVWLVRVAAWGTVLVLAALAFNLRSGATARVVENGANGDQVNGETSQGVPIWAVVDGGRVREIRMVWRFECDNGGELEPFGVTLRDSVDGFDFRGREFSFAEERELPASEDGWVARASVDVSGERRDGGALAGEASAVMRFTRGSERGTTCRSGPVQWHIRRPGVKP
jgi:hypothetical protein